MKKQILFLSLVVIIGIIPVVNASHIGEDDECIWLDKFNFTPVTQEGIFGFSSTNLRGVSRNASNSGDIWQYSSINDDFKHEIHSTRAIFGIWGLSQNDIWALRDATTGIGDLHYDGITWTNILPSVGIVDHTRMWGTASNNLWAIAGGTGGQIEKWDGVSWITHTTFPGATFRELFGFAENDIWAAGNLASNAIIVHWDGVSWTDFSSMWPPTATTIIRGIWGESSDFWLTGDTTNFNLIHWDGSSFTLTGGLSNSGLGMTGIALDSIWIPMVGGKVAHYDGNQWIERNTGFPDSFFDIWVLSNDNVWISDLGSGVIAKEFCHTCQLDIVNLTIPTLFVFIIFLGVIAFITKKMVGG